MPKPTWCGLSAHEKTHHLYMVGFNMQKKKDMHNGKNVSSEKGVMVELRGFKPLTSTMRMWRATEACVTHPRNIMIQLFNRAIEFIRGYYRIHRKK